MKKGFIVAALIGWSWLLINFSYYCGREFVYYDIAECQLTLPHQATMQDFLNCLYDLRFSPSRPGDKRKSALTKSLGE
jgi:hypothetical protein